MVEANAGRDDQNGGEDDVIQDTKGFGFAGHDTDVFHCHDGGTAARLWASQGDLTVPSPRCTLRGQVIVHSMR